jgi:iron only hydrogenase large subunit-like protein
MPCYDKKLEAAREELTLPETKVRSRISLHME